MFSLCKKCLPWNCCVCWIHAILSSYNNMLLNPINYQVDFPPIDVTVIHSNHWFCVKLYIVKITKANKTHILRLYFVITWRTQRRWCDLVFSLFLAFRLCFVILKSCESKITGFTSWSCQFICLYPITNVFWLIKLANIFFIKKVNKSVVVKAICGQLCHFNVPYSVVVFIRTIPSVRLMVI